MSTALSADSPSRVLGIQFSVMSPDAIRKGAVADITSRDTYVNNKPVINGLFDPRMGVLEPGFACPTDGRDYISCPGYFGKLELARPVFAIQHLATVLKILRCCCCQCSKLLISKERHAHLSAKKPDARWNAVFALASKVRRCGEETTDGCGCKQPSKIRKEGFATIVAEWDKIEGLSEEDTSMAMTPEIVLKILRRLSDEDIEFMGFSPRWSRPEWMITEVLAVPPPAVRPSVKHDTQQRSEDDLSHILANIVKANRTLAEKLQADAAQNVIDDWTIVVQYYVATLVDNKIPGVAAVAQRSGRPLKALKERLNGKAGRMRGNLMGKRVDYSARSVITPDPHIPIEKLGIPMKIAMNLTTPVIVNEHNIAFLTGLVRNGPDVYPGAKILERANGDNISLRYVDRESVSLELGDKVHRHLLNGDPVMFNRQPTLHRMSMMCHTAQIMPTGDTFRMNVGDTKPYNADFDGDEMNLHMPQGPESAAELKHLAAVRWQLISPANNKSIVGIFQDSLLGAYLFSEARTFSRAQAMNLLMRYDRVDTSKLPQGDEVTSYDILTQLMPPLSLRYKTKRFKDGDDARTSPAVLEVANGVYKRGQLDKSVLGDGSRGLIQRICNDFGNGAAARFINSLQDVVTEFMKTSAYSVGISDLVADTATNAGIVAAIVSKKDEVQQLIDQVQLGAFENTSGRSNRDEFEMRVNNVLNAASLAAGKIGRESLGSDNRFVTMVNAGSKGSDLNISQMIACLGQQNVDGKRIPYGFEARTLPHFPKFDDSPAARGFVGNSFISGLTPTELFFHAQGGREGLIDTAVKTSQTGYIQRRLVKGSEDLKQEYDGTVRNAKGKIIQFTYGDDGFDPVRVEQQSLPLPDMDISAVYAHYSMPTAKLELPYTKDAAKRAGSQARVQAEKIKSVITEALAIRGPLVRNVHAGIAGTRVYAPVAFRHIIDNTQGQCGISPGDLTDVTCVELLDMVDGLITALQASPFYPPSKLFVQLARFYLTPRDLLVVRRFNRVALDLLMAKIRKAYDDALSAPGEMVGIIAAQSIGEPTTQMTLNTFHFAGVASKSNVTRGVPRIEEILSLSENPKNPSCTVHQLAHNATSQEAARRLASQLEHTRLRAIVTEASIYFDPDPDTTSIANDEPLLERFQAFERLMDECGASRTDVADSCWIVRLVLDHAAMLDRGISMDDVHFAVKKAYEDDVSCTFADYSADSLVMRARVSAKLLKKKTRPVDRTDEVYVLKAFQDKLIDGLVLRGVCKISKVVPRKIPDAMIETDTGFERQEVWVLDTVGTNLLDLLALDTIDVNSTTTNDIQEVYRVLGIEAARQCIMDELTEVLAHDSTYINYHHLSLLCDRMTCNAKMVSIFRHGINNDDIGPIAKASFEEAPEMFLRAARHAELDTMRGISANVMCGQVGYFGTGLPRILVDYDALEDVRPAADPPSAVPDIDDMFASFGAQGDGVCSAKELEMPSHVLDNAPMALAPAADYVLDM